MLTTINVFGKSIDLDKNNPSFVTLKKYSDIVVTLLADDGKGNCAQKQLHVMKDYKKTADEFINEFERLKGYEKTKYPTPIFELD